MLTRCFTPNLRPTVTMLMVAMAVMLIMSPAAHGQRSERRLRPPWWQRTTVRMSEHYAIRTDLPLEEARAYSRHLDFMYEEYARRLASIPPRVPEQLNVYLFSSQKEYQHTLATRWGIDGTGSGGIFFVNAAGSGLALWTGPLPPQRVYQVIQHEGFHQFAYSRFGNDLPLWVNEGLAEFFGEAVRVGDRLVLGQSTPRVIEAVRNAIENSEHTPFSQLLQMTNADWRARVVDGNAALLYHQSWSMVHFLVYGDDGKYQLPFERYLRLLNSGVPAEAAFIRVFGDDVGAFEERWRANVMAMRPSAFVTALERIEFLAEGALALSREGIVPDSLAELRAAMRERQFEHIVDRHGVRTRLRAEDDENFLIPVDDLTPEPPVFEVEAPSRKRIGRLTAPPKIQTRYVRPNGLSIRWKRDRRPDRDGEALRYEIIAR